jgi:hypothetical protein
MLPAAIGILIGAVALLALAVGGRQLFSPSGESCQLPALDFMEAAQPGVVEAGAKVGFAARDQSGTFVGFCVETMSLVQPRPQLASSTGPLRPIGGTLSQLGEQFANYVIFPPTTDTDVSVTQDGQTSAHLRFDPRSDDDCPLKTDGSVTVETCGALVVLRWTSSVRIAAKDVAIADVLVSSQGEEEPSGFYLLELQDAPGGLSVRFATQIPASHQLTLTMRSLELVSGEVLPTTASASVTLVDEMPEEGGPSGGS